MIGKTINGFTLQRLLGMGGMAEVWYAENEIGKPAAVKLLDEDLSHNAQIVERFRNEAVVMVKLDHPNIRQVYGYGIIDERPAIIMEYLEGDDLKALMKQGRRFTEDELVKWWNQMVGALNYTHTQNIVHRDIKPGNIFVDRNGNIKLLDFGIAKVRESISSTQTGQKIGTLMYMSPEQVKDSKHVDYRTDIYSLAVTFVHLISGKKPYNSDTSSDFEISEQIVYKPLDLNDLPDNWRTFLAPYLAKDPAARPALRSFAATAETPHVPRVDDGTIVDAGRTPNDRPSTKTPHNGTTPSKGAEGIKTPLSPTPKDKPKSKKGLWIGLGIAVAVIVALLLLLKSKQEPTLADPDTMAYKTCKTVADYRAYISEYGSDALHYADAKAFVDKYEADSIRNAVDEQNRASAKEAQEELERREKIAYDACTTEKMEPEAEQKAKAEAEAKAKAKAEAEQKTGIETDAKNKTESEQKGGNGTANGHEYVDLGLPSGTLWATCNIGASSPEGYGNYYAWGETSTKNTYNWDTYKYANGNYDKITKYCGDSDFGDNGFSDELTTLQMGDDPAIVWGSGWRMPTKAQWDELLNYTTNKWTIQNGVKGRLFTAKNGRTIFIPAAGYRWSDRLDEAESYGDYWSRSVYTSSFDYSWGLYFDSGECDTYYSYRYNGFTVRPVRMK